MLVQSVERARYSACVEEEATCDCFLLPHCTGHPLIKMMNPVLDLLQFHEQVSINTRNAYIYIYILIIHYIKLQFIIENLAMIKIQFFIL